MAIDVAVELAVHIAHDEGRLDRSVAPQTQFTSQSCAIAVPQHAEEQGAASQVDEKHVEPVAGRMEAADTRTLTNICRSGLDQPSGLLEDRTGPCFAQIRRLNQDERPFGTSSKSDTGVR